MEVIAPPQAAALPGVITVNDLYTVYVPNMVSNHNEYHQITKTYFKIDYGMLNAIGMSTTNNTYTQTPPTLNIYQRAFGGYFIDSITSIGVFLTQSKTLPVGTEIRIYGVRA
jgi:hypothetical protein